MTRLRSRLPRLPVPLLPATLYLTLLLLAPLLLLFSSGFLESHRGELTGRLDFSAYRSLFTDSFYAYVFLRTFLIATSVTVLCLLFGYPIAYLYTKVSSRMKMAILLCVMAPLLTSALVRTFGWIVILGSDGAVNNALMALGLIDRPLQFLFTLKGVMIGMTQVLLPFMIVPLIAALQSIPPNLEEAAANLGASRWQTFWRVTVPQSLPGVAAGVTLVFVLAFSEFTVSALMGGGTFAVVSVYIFQAMTTLLDWGLGAALAALLLLSSAAIVTAFNSITRKLMPWTQQQK